jgi:predicted transcriptional regulator
MEENCKYMGMAIRALESYWSNNEMHKDDMEDFITRIYTRIQYLCEGRHEEPELIPSVSINKSVTDEYIICLEDGLKFKSLKRHIKTKYNMTPEQYRAKWGLSRDYPMVAPHYSAQRSKLAFEMKLGKKNTKNEDVGIEEDQSAGSKKTKRSKKKWTSI